MKRDCIIPHCDMKHSGWNVKRQTERLTRVIPQVKNTCVYYLGRGLPEIRAPFFFACFDFRDSVLR